MPYIQDHAARDSLDEGGSPLNVGDLTYALTKAVDRFIQAQGEVSYQVYAEALGALSATSHELYRRKIADYENLKLLENGDVFSPTLTPVKKKCGGSCEC